MINLLPPQNKRALIEEKNWRLSMIMSILFFFFLICLSLIIFIFKNSMVGDLEVQKEFVTQREKEFNDPNLRDLETNLNNFNQTLGSLDAFYTNQKNWTNVIEKISQVVPPLIHLNILSILPQITKEGGLETACSLAGIAPTREDLINLKDNLEKEPFFRDVAPTVNWVETDNINFIINFKLK